MAAMNTLSPPMKPRHVFTYSLVVYFSFFKLSSSSRPINDGVVTHFNGSSAAELAQSQWSTAGATWYGGPDGDGSDGIGGACGYSTAVSQPPFSSMVTAVGPSLYNSGKECGACYQVKCNKNPSCSGNPVRVVITDSCPGGPCASESAHFDLSGTAFGAMALSGHESKLLEFEAGDGDLATVDLQQSSDDQWEPMQQSWGAVWKLDSGNRLNPPFSIKLTSRFSGETLVAKNVIPAGWQAGATYRSLVNFN
ncbi:EXPB5 [Linum perenne]